jgi:hypothetical protein
MTNNTSTSFLIPPMYLFEASEPNGVRKIMQRSGAILMNVPQPNFEITIA